MQHIDDPATESWRPVLGYEGLYQVSDQGRVQSESRVIKDRQGRTRRLVGALMRPQKNGPMGYAGVSLARDGRKVRRQVHQLVLESFQGARPTGKHVVRHLNGNYLDNRVENLAWGTAAENMGDQVTHGTHRYSKQSHCKAGHAFDATNTYRHGPDGRYRRCRKCSLERCRNARAAQKAA